jgi:hypothetical protein
MDQVKWKKSKLSGKWLRDMFQQYLSLIFSFVNEAFLIKSINEKGLTWDTGADAFYDHFTLNTPAWPGSLQSSLPKHTCLQLERILLPIPKCKAISIKDIAERLPCLSIPEPEIDHSFM